jgi:hypothetical protein
VATASGVMGWLSGFIIEKNAAIEDVIVEASPIAIWW